MNKVLFIEDDKEYAKIIKRLLESKNLIVDYVDNSVEALDIIENKIYDLVIADLYMNTFQGTQVAEYLLQNNKECKFIIISNSTDPLDEVRSLKLDIDDFIRKDASLDVFIQRVMRVLKTEKKKKNTDLLTSSSENIEVDVLNRIVKKNGEVAKLTILEFDLLVYFLKHKNELLSRENIIEDVWKLSPDSAEIDLRNIDTHIKNLRKKLSINVIASVRGIGYRWYEE